MSRHRNDRGLLATEVALLAPFVLMIAILVVFLNRSIQHEARAQSAADAAARAASLVGVDSPEAATAAIGAAEAQCLGDVSDLELRWHRPERGSPTFRPGAVVVELVCGEQFNGFSALGIDDERAVRASGVAAVEFWRADP